MQFNEVTLFFSIAIGVMALFAIVISGAAIESPTVYATLP